MWYYISLGIIPIISLGYFGYIIFRYIFWRNITSVKKIFNQESLTTTFPIYLKNEKWKIYTSYICFIIFSTLIFIGFCFILSQTDDGYLQYMLTNSIIYILSILSILYFIYISSKSLKLINFSNYTEVKEFINNQFINPKNFEVRSYDLDLLYFDKYINYLDLAKKRYINKISSSLSYEKLYKLFLKYIRACSWVLNQALSKQFVELNIEIKTILKNTPEIIFENFWIIAYNVFKKNNVQ
ncbi:hypothetical protein [Spiroplasma turonicum]|uniref:Transmembrane protein n=1 Tax=Spiroplasma turonicum TaxID=216946 RepID=A0A0K1P854_9MOLU|nr:hypothetical protein [Spiroplasma turonicum]AKU80062.1 hypothetical protein STURON_00816 [Spiroplasma turonicum]ALX71064.1 hypothetical protein STURO_v1c08130 [Spiroplasma turonicum]